MNRRAVAFALSLSVAILVVSTVETAASVADPTTNTPATTAPGWGGWVTSPDRGTNSAAPALQPISPTSAVSTATLTLQPGQRGQTWLGAGGSVTDASVQMINADSSAPGMLFSPTQTNGAQLSYLRLPLSATDMSPTSDPDWYWSDASKMPAEELRAVDLVLSAQKLNPSISVVATAWSAPPSFKTNGSLDGGDLKPGTEAAYAALLVGQAKAVIAKGVHLRAMTVGNEPEISGKTYATMGMTDAQISTIALDASAQLKSIGVSLWALDHNWDDWAHADAEVSGAPGAFAAAAFHCYGGTPDQLVNVTVPTVMTECTGTTDTWSGTFGFSEKYIVKTVQEGAAGVLFWNLALNTKSGPNNGRGCTNCRGLLTVQSGKTPAPGPEFYELAQLDRAARPGDVRIGVTASSGIAAVAFQRSDGTVGIYGHNGSSATQVVTVSGGGVTNATFSIPAGDIFTLRGPASSATDTNVVKAFHIIRVSATGASWYVDGSMTKHSIVDGDTYLCLTGRKVPVIDGLTQSQVDAVRTGSPQPLCLSPAHFNGDLLQAPNGYSYTVQGNVRHWIPNGGTFLCLKAWGGEPVRGPYTWDQINSIPENTASHATCSATGRARNTVIRESDNAKAYFVDASLVRHSIPDGETYYCMTAKYPLIDGLTADHVNALASGPAVSPCISPARFEGSIARAMDKPDPKPSYAIVGGKRHWIPDGWTYAYLTAHGFAVMNVPTEAAILNSVPKGSDETPVLDAATFPKSVIMRESNGTSFYLDSASVRHPIPDGGTYLCLSQWRGIRVIDNLTAGQVATFSLGSTQTCSTSSGYNKVLRVSATGASYYVDSSGVRHWIPDGGTYLCMTAWRGIPLIDNLTASQVAIFTAGSTQSCSDSVAYNKVLRVGATGASYYVDGGGTRHAIPNGGTYLCMTAWDGVAVLNNLAASQINAFPAGATQSCAVTQAYNMILRVGSTGASYLVDGAGVRHSIPNGGTFDCLRYWQGYGLIDNLDTAHVNAFAVGGDASCTATQAFNTIVRVGSTGASYLVDGTGVRHWIPNGGTFDCLRYWKGYYLYDNLTQPYIDALPAGGDASCTATEAFNTIVRVGSTGASYLVDGSGVRHWIPNGGTFGCLYYWDGYRLYDNLTQPYIDALPAGGDASCVVSQAFNTVIRETTTGTAYYVDGGGTRHWIQDGATYNCLIKTHSYYHDLTWDQIDAIPEGSWEPKLNC